MREVLELTNTLAEKGSSMEIEKYIQEKAALIDARIEKYIPRTFSKEAIIFTIEPPRYAHNLESINKAIAEPIWEFLDRGGKRWRPALFLLICEALGKKDDVYADFAIIPEVVHNGTLIIDDLEDASEFRRGKPSTYRIFGTDIAVNAGNAMYYLPLLSLMLNRNNLSPDTLSHVYEIYIEEMIKLSIGQAIDIAWHRGLVDLKETSERDYLQMCAYKTGTLARMAAKIAVVLCDGSEEQIEGFGSFAESIGVAFQMQDDVLDLTGARFAGKKGGRGQDITEGKRSLIVIHTLSVARQSERDRLLEILGMHSRDEAIRHEAIALMASYGSVEYVKDLSRRMVSESWSSIERIVPDSGAKEKLKAFAEFLIKRQV